MSRLQPHPLPFPQFSLPRELSDRVGIRYVRAVPLTAIKCARFSNRAGRPSPPSLGWACVFAVFGGFLATATSAMAAAIAVDVDFNRDIRPIFSDHCYACHGPDEAKRKGGLRLDSQEEAFKELKSGHRALVVGDPTKSTLLTRIRNSDPDEVMPPPKEGKPLTARQIDLLTRWVNAGATWKQHWSFVAPDRPVEPAVANTRWTRNPVDQFLLSRLEREPMTPGAEAERPTLIRRATLDLTGLPPTIEEVDAFLADGSKGAYEKVIDRLLSSAHYGERMAAQWLDLARFADTSGYHFDGTRYMWLWRDWTIRAFNENMPHDQFTVEQLAGDLLPNPTQSQRVATGFCRNNMTTDEGGADPDEYLNKYVVDRVNTLGNVWLGVTVGCAECHDHKYDPVTTRDFYRLYAFFNSVPEKGLDRIRTDNPPPRIPVPAPDQAVKFVEAEFRVRDAEKTLQDRENEIGEKQEKWERLTQARLPRELENEPGTVHFPMDESITPRGNTHSTAPDSTRTRTATITITTTPPPPSTARWVVSEQPEYVDGRVGKALRLSGRTHVEIPADNLPVFGRTNAFSFGGWVRFEGDGCVASKQTAAPEYRGIDLLVTDRRFEVHFARSRPDDALKVKTREQFGLKQWNHVVVTYDGSSKASGVRIHVNGRPRDLETQTDKLSGDLINDEPLRFGSRKMDAKFTGLLDDFLFYPRALSTDDVRQLAWRGFLPIVVRTGGKRTSEEQDDLRRFYRENYAIDLIQSEAAVANARKTREELVASIPTTMVMEDMQPSRDTFLLIRGDFRNPGEKLSAGTPLFLPPIPSESPTNRLGLARWLVAKNHPLMARVTVNRFWGLFFGTGLVKTINDFGAQGEWPSHPELLDWLACQFRDGGRVWNRPEADEPGVSRDVTSWNVKELVRLLVTSAAYRQSAVVSREKLDRDAYNRLLARGPRVRLDAEFIRDNALAVSGLLNARIGGPSVKPYQPSGIWDGTDSKYDQDKGDLLYRRGMYVFWRRSAHYPSFATFDAPNREVCTFLRQRTQTPLQSLVLMNDPAYVECARGLAQRVLREEPNDLERRLVLAFRHTLGRIPKPQELTVLRETYQAQRVAYREDTAAADKLLAVGESKLPETVDKPELAAMTSVANVLLNLSETITK
ncbi:MAG: DUF1553 domain-containing protein [Pedosphaera sp.]|nr:DUF1553 domain-containing protein [Pedosphaera sp.]